MRRQMAPSLALAFVVSLTVLVQANGQQPSSDSKFDAKAAAVVATKEIRRQRSKAEERVTSLNAKFPPTATLTAKQTADLATAKKKYGDTKAEFDGLIAAFLVAIKTGDKTFQKKFKDNAVDAFKANQDFCAFGDVLLERTPGNLGADDIVKAVGSIIDLVRKIKKENRDALAQAVEPEIRWKSWAELSPKPDAKPSQ